MKYNYLFITVVFIGLAFNSIKSQSFFESKDLSFTASYGYGKILYYNNFTQAYIGAGGQAAVEYSPSWGFKVEKSFILNDRFDFSLGLCHITITEKTDQTAKPGWFGFREKHLSQGFIHLVPSLSIKLPDERFSFNMGLRFGTANFINSNARESSHSLGRLHADIDAELGVSLLMVKRFFLDVEWIHGLTKYDYSISTPVVSISYFKYHSFQFGVRYILRYAKKA